MLWCFSWKVNNGKLIELVNYAFLLYFRSTAAKRVGMSELCLCWSDMRLLASLCHHHFVMFGGPCCSEWHPMALWYLWNKGDFTSVVFLLKTEIHMARHRCGLRTRSAAPHYKCSSYKYSRKEAPLAGLLTALPRAVLFAAVWSTVT